MRICFVGDSFVNGTCDPECLGWTGRVCAAARKQGYNLTYYNLGVRGETSADIASRWHSEVSRRLPESVNGRVVFSFGTNDTTLENGKTRVELDDSTDNIRQIITAAKPLFPVLMVSPAPIANAEQNSRTAELSQRFYVVCNQLGVPYLDVFHPLQASPVWMKEAAANDGAHPGSAGYLKLAQLVQRWDEIFGSKDNCTAYFEEYLLAEIEKPLVLGLDEVDLVFQYPEIASDFFGLLRAWHEDAKSRDIWKKLRLLVVHSTEVYIPMNINQSPFNVGLPVELPEFTSEQVQDLARRHGLNWNASQVEQLMAMVGGHPFLVRVALYDIARQDMTLEQLLQEAPTEAGLYGDHLRRHLWNLQQRPELVEAVKQVMAASCPVRLEPVQAFQLESMGIVHLQGNEVIPRCDLYRQYFSDRLRGYR